MSNDLGLIHVYYGNGKGKTTAALGLGVRAAGYDKKVCMIQFLKSGDTGELFSAKRLAPYLNIVQFDKPKGFYFNMNEQEREELKKETQQGFAYAQEQLESGEWDLVILDEVLGSLTNGLLSVDQVTAALQNKHSNTEVVLTGRELPDEIENMADYVTEMKEHKHPMHRGVKARKGIEY